MSTVDIDDMDFLRAVDKCCGEGPWANGWDVADELGVSWLEARKKMRRVRKRGLVSGCDCQCRGDWELTIQGRARLVGVDVAPVDK